MFKWISNILRKRKILAMAVFVAQFTVACAHSGAERKQELMKAFPQDQAAVQVLDDKRHIEVIASLVGDAWEKYQKVYEGLVEISQGYIDISHGDRIELSMIWVRDVLGDFQAYVQSEKKLLDAAQKLEKLGFDHKATEIRERIYAARHLEKELPYTMYRAIIRTNVYGMIPSILRQAVKFHDVCKAAGRTEVVKEMHLRLGDGSVTHLIENINGETGSNYNLKEFPDWVK